MSQSYRNFGLRPTASQTSAIVNTGRDVISEFLDDMDAQKFMLVAGITLTVGVGTAALIHGRRKKRLDADKKPSRVSFKSPGNTVNEDIANANTNTQPTKNVVNPVAVRCNALAEVPRANVFPPRPEPIRENRLVLKQCPRGRQTPCIAPFPLKLETFLRVHSIKYELDFDGHEPKIYGSPWVKFNGEDITDSQNVVQFLIEKYNIRVENELSNEKQAMATAYTLLLENHLYWGIALWRWVYDGARTLKEIQLLPKKIQELIPDVCKTVAQAAWFHGIGKMSPAEVKAAVLKDLSDLSKFLGDNKYFLKTDVPTELDCTAFGMLAQFLWNMKGPFHDAILNKHSNLREFCWNMRLTYWPDWSDCLNNNEFYTDDPYPFAESNTCNLKAMR